MSISEDNLVYRKGISKLIKESLPKYCFFPDENCNYISRAHSMQENRILNKISVNGKVLVTDYEIRDNDLTFIFREEGKGRATTFTGFCNYHDTILFIPIELQDYVCGNKEQEFLFAYRALAVGHYHKLYHEESMGKLLDLIKCNDYGTIYKYFPNFKKATPSYINLLQIGVNSFKHANENLEKLRVAMNINLKRKRYYKVCTKAIVFMEEYHFAVSSYVFIPYDIEGNMINDLKSNTAYNAPIFLTIFPQGGKTYVLFSYLSKDKERFNFLDTQLLNKTPEEQKIIISNLVCKYISNFVISPSRWCQLPTYKRNKYLECLNLKKHFFDKHSNLVMFPDLNLFI